MSWLSAEIWDLSMSQKLGMWIYAARGSRYSDIISDISHWFLTSCTKAKGPVLTAMQMYFSNTGRHIFDIQLGSCHCFQMQDDSF